jgi:hypothetical protein
MVRKLRGQERRGMGREMSEWMVKVGCWDEGMWGERGRVWGVRVGVE